MPDYMTGFGNHFATTAVPGALPEGRNSPQRPAFGLYAEQLSGTAFTAPRAENRRSWLYRLRPSGDHGAYSRYGDGNAFAGADGRQASPDRLRWSPLDMRDVDADLIDGLIAMASTADPAAAEGVTVHIYRASRDMAARAFFNADAEMLFVPQEGGLRLLTELGILDLAPGEIGSVPRGLRFRAELPDGQARGYVGENHGASFRLPDLGPIGSNGLANPRDFLAPVAWFEDRDAPLELIQKFQGRLWRTQMDHSPLDVVAWHGNLYPWKYDLARFNVIGTVSFDHPDPSIFTVVTAPSERPGVADCDFVIFPPRWMVAEDSFRPPWFHRNVMSECMGLIHGAYDAKAEGFAPGALSIHNRMSSHGPDVATWRTASEEAMVPRRIDGTMAFMFESRLPFLPTERALALPELQRDYDDSWRGFPKARLP